MQDTLRLLCIHNNRWKLEEELVQREEQPMEGSHREIAGNLIDCDCLFDRQRTDTTAFECREMPTTA